MHILFLLPGGLPSCSHKDKEEYLGQNGRVIDGYLLVMSKKGDLTDLRLRLDEAITYGTHREAVKLAKQGLKEAAERGFEGEDEYFRGQIKLLSKNFTTAIEHFDAAIKHNPNDGAA